MKSNLEKGKEMEKFAMFLLNDSFDELTHIGGKSPFDILATRNGETLGINVKSGIHNFTIGASNLRRLYAKMPSIIPAYLFIDGKNSYLFKFSEIYEGSGIYPEKHPSISVTFTDEEFERLVEAKGDLSWHDFILKRVEAKR